MASRSVPHGVLTAAPFNTEVFCLGAALSAVLDVTDPYIEILEPAVYQASGVVTWGSTVNAGSREIRIDRFDSSDTFLETIAYVSHGQQESENPSSVAFLADAGDRIRLTAFHATGFTETITDDGSRAHLEVVYVRPIGVDGEAYGS